MMFNIMSRSGSWLHRKTSFRVLIGDLLSCLSDILVGLFSFCVVELHFAAAEMNTEPNRYLLIATSGGLNQQRTGVSLYSLC